MMPHDEKKNSIPLKRIALYKHGIGYFERSGKFQGPGEIELMCGPDEIDDMLKSLLVLSAGGRKVSAITYESSKTLETRLSEFGFDLRNCQGMVELIVQLKGAPVTVDHSGETLTGRIIGLDETLVLVGESVIREHQVVLYSDEKSMQRIALSSIRNISVNDPSLANEIQQQLELLFQATRKKDRKLLKVQVNDTDEHDLTIAYSIPSPIWKTSYRLVATDDQLIIQGSAIVDNTQEEDWDDVQMTLVSASPISFIQPLYDPVQPQRPTINPQGVDSSRPFVAERGHQAAQAEPAARMRQTLAAPAPASSPASGQTGSWGSPQGMTLGGMAAGSGGGLYSVDDQEIDRIFSENLGVSIGVATQSTGELFEYRIEAPVTVPRNSSALITIVQQTIEGERISLYNENRNAKNPFCAIKLKNTTGLTLESGPVTIMESNAYAGEALLDVVKPDDTRFIAYATDLGVHVIVRQESVNKPIWRVRVVNNYLYFDYKQQHKKVYHLENLTDRKKIIFIEHPVVAQRNYVGLEKPVETTEHFYRFRVELDPKEAVSQVVPEETDVQTHVYLENFDLFKIPELTWAHSQNYVDAKFMAFLDEVSKRREEIFVLQKTERQLREQVARYQADQERARENVRTLGTGGDRYRKAIDQAEDQLVKANSDLAQVLGQIADKKAEFRAFLSKDLTAEIADAAESVAAR